MAESGSYSNVFVAPPDGTVARLVLSPDSLPTAWTSVSFHDEAGILETSGDAVACDGLDFDVLALEWTWPESVKKARGSGTWRVIAPWGTRLEVPDLTIPFPFLAEAPDPGTSTIWVDGIALGGATYDDVRTHPLALLARFPYHRNKVLPGIDEVCESACTVSVPGP